MTTEELKKVFNRKKWKWDNKRNKECPGFKEISFNDFLAWFNLDEFNKGCHYCGTSNATSNELYHLRPYATRGGKRGKRLELDRINPILDYDNLDNIVWCCYWCNNAKSNFFKGREFYDIAKAIGIALSNIRKDYDLNQKK